MHSNEKGILLTLLERRPTFDLRNQVTVTVQWRVVPTMYTFQTISVLIPFQFPIVVLETLLLKTEYCCLSFHLAYGYTFIMI